MAREIDKSVPAPAPAPKPASKRSLATFNSDSESVEDFQSLADLDHWRMGKADRIRQKEPSSHQAPKPWGTKKRLYIFEIMGFIFVY